jgi:hypothetical protein
MTSGGTFVPAIMWMHASRMHSRALRGVLAASLLVFLPTTVEAEDALRCFGGISPETAQQVFERLKAPLAEPACEFEGVTTQGPVLLATWKHDGTALPSARVQVRACMSPPPPGSGKFVVEIPEGLTAACPSAAQIASQIGSVLLQRAPRIEPTPETTPLYVGLQWLLAALVLLAGAVAVRELRRWPDPAWTGLLLGSFGLALTVRLTLPHVPTNWYSEVLPATGPPTWMRFGPGSFAWQALVRRVAPWNETTLYFSQSLLGSLAIPLFVLVLRELAVGWRAAAATAILFALSPFHARISASSSEHVLASTLTIAQLAAWLAGVRRRDPWLILLAMLLLPAAVLTRVDALIQVALIPLWSLARGRSSWRPYFLYALVAAATGVLAYVAIVRTSNHPSPELPMMAQALRDVFPQYLKLATQAPGWFPLCSVALTGLGVLVMLLKRPALLGCIVVSLLASFGLLGRSFLHDELVGARYFLFTIPMFLLLAPRVDSGAAGRRRRRGPHPSPARVPDELRLSRRVPVCSPRAGELAGWLLGVRAADPQRPDRGRSRLLPGPATLSAGAGLSAPQISRFADDRARGRRSLSAMCRVLRIGEVPGRRQPDTPRPLGQVHRVLPPALWRGAFGGRLHSD